MATFTLRVNGAAREIEADPASPLIFTLRNQLGLTGVKLGCGLEQCGSCAVLVDNVSTLCCNRPVAEFTGPKSGSTSDTLPEIVTVERIGPGWRFWETGTKIPPPSGLVPGARAVMDRYAGANIRMADGSTLRLAQFRNFLAVVGEQTTRRTT